MKQYLLDLAIDQRCAWYDQLAKAVLWLLSLLYNVAVRITQSLYQIGLLSSKQLPKPVICVGNMIVGGAGKTPMVIRIAQYLQSKNIRPAILIRGYMDQVGVQSDEVMMLKQVLPNVPVCVGADRYASGMQLLSDQDVDVFIMDDGFQHWRLKRDLDIVLLDAACPFANGHVIPRGLLREPKSNVGRADVIVLLKKQDADTPVDINHEVDFSGMIVVGQQAPIKLYNLIEKKDIPLESLAGEPIIAFCGIGNPQKFWATLKKLGCKVMHQATFIDHHVYDQHDMAMLIQQAQSMAVKYVVTTHKDAVKVKPFLSQFGEVKCVVVDIETRILEGRDVFFEKINEKVVV